MLCDNVHLVGDYMLQSGPFPVVKLLCYKTDKILFHKANQILKGHLAFVEKKIKKIDKCKMLKT